MFGKKGGEIVGTIDNNPEVIGQDIGSIIGCEGKEFAVQGVEVTKIALL